MTDLNQKLAELYADFIAKRTTPDAFCAQVYELTLRPLIFHILAKRPGMPRDEATDIAHDTFTSFVLTLRKEKTNFDQVLPWLKRVATNKIIDEARIRLRAGMQHVHSEDFNALLVDRHGTEADRARSLDIEKRLAVLTERQREIVLLSAEGYTQDEIGKMMDIPATTVAHEVRVARQRMKDVK